MLGATKRALALEIVRALPSQPIETVMRNPDDLRITDRFYLRFQDNSLDELAQQLELAPQLQPVVINLANEVIVGNRRVKAFRMLNERRVVFGIPEAQIRCEVFDLSEEESVAASLVDNLAHRTLSDVDIAYACSKLKTKFNMTEAKIGAFFSKTQAWVSQQLDLLNLPLDIKELIHLRQMPKAVGQVLCELSDGERRAFLLKAEMEGRRPTVAMIKKYIVEQRSRFEPHREIRINAGRPQPLTASQMEELLERHSNGRHDALAAVFRALLMFMRAQITSEAVLIQECVKYLGGGATKERVA